jgi:hypothetical protein
MICILSKPQCLLTNIHRNGYFRLEIVLHPNLFPYAPTVNRLNTYGNQVAKQSDYNIRYIPFDIECNIDINFFCSIFFHSDKLDFFVNKYTNISKAYFS